MGAAPESRGAGEPAAARGPLRVHPSNPRYFADPSGRAVLLVGSHTWNNLQDMGEADPPAPFDFTRYLDFLAERGHDFIRLWRWELVTWDSTDDDETGSRRVTASPHPWARTGPGLAPDGKPRFDLERFDDAYFRRLRDRVAAAGDRGIYVSIMLFEGWGLRFAPRGWERHPFHPLFNVNGLDGVVGDVKGIDLFTLSRPRVTALQEAYVRKVIDTVGDLDNVLYEIANESDFTTTEWQYHMIRSIRAFESKRPKRHPIGMTSIGYGVDDLDRLLKSPADWISPNPDLHDYKGDPPAADGAKVLLPDTDHLWGVGGDVGWAWKSFLRGLNPIFMDPYERRVLDRGPDARWEPVRRALGTARRLADRMDLASMSPRRDLASTGYCLADPGKELLVFLPEGGEAKVDLSAMAGPVRVEWIHPVEGTARPGAEVTGGGKRSFLAPPGDATVLHLRRR